MKVDCVGEGASGSDVASSDWKHLWREAAAAGGNSCWKTGTVERSVVVVCAYGLLLLLCLCVRLYVRGSSVLLSGVSYRCYCCWKIVEGEIKQTTVSWGTGDRSGDNKECLVDVVLLMEEEGWKKSSWLVVSCGKGRRSSLYCV